MSEKQKQTIEFSTQKLESEIGEVGAIFHLKKGEIIVIDKFVVSSKGILRVAYYDNDGNRHVSNKDVFKRKIENCKEPDENYREEIIAIVKKIKRIDKELLDAIDDIKDKTKRVKFEEKAMKEIDEIGEIIDIDTNKNGVSKEMLQKVDIEDFFQVKNSLIELIQLKKQIELELKKEKKEKKSIKREVVDLDEDEMLGKIKTDISQEKWKEKKNLRKKEFEKRYGINVDYIIVTTNKSGHEAPTSSFTLIGYSSGKVKKDDRVEIKWHNEEGKKEKISLKKFQSLLNRGFKKETNEIVGKELTSEEEKLRGESGNKQDQDIEENNNSQEVEEAGQRAKKYRDEYFEKMGWNKNDEEQGNDNNQRNKELEDDLRKFEERIGIKIDEAKELKKDDEEVQEKRKNKKSFDNKNLEAQLESIIKDNPNIEKEIIKKTLNPEMRENSYSNADLKDKVLMLLGAQSNQARIKYLKKDYDMDKRLGGMKRFFGKTFHIDNFEKEIESYKKEYEEAREKYKNAILTLEGINDREEAEILARDFEISERLRWRSDKLDIAIENNPTYENSKKFLLGAVNKYREMRRWPSNKISELFGFKGLSKGVGIVSGMLITGKVLKEAGMVGNPAFRVFSVAVSSVGYKQIAETLAEKKRIKMSEKEIKKGVNKFGANFEAGRNIDELSEWLSNKNKNLDKDIQSEKYWRNWRTIMAGGVALATFFGGEILGEKMMKHFGEDHTGDSLSDGDEFKDAQINAGLSEQTVSSGPVNTSRIKSEVENFLSNNKIKSDIKVDQTNFSGEHTGVVEEPYPLDYDGNHEVNHDVDSEGVDAPNGIIKDGNVEIRGAVKVDNLESQEIQNGNEQILHSEKPKGARKVLSKISDIVNPNLEQHRNITGSELKIAYGLGFTPTEYARLNDLPLANVSNSNLNEFLERVPQAKEIDLSETTVGEFFRKININNLPKDISLHEITGEKYIEYLANIINNEAMDLKKVISSGDIGKWNQIRSHLAIGELDENFGKFYSEVSNKFSLNARPTESVENWIMRVTKFAYDRGILSEVKQDLEEIVSEK